MKVIRAGRAEWLDYAGARLAVLASLEQLGKPLADVGLVEFAPGQRVPAGNEMSVHPGANELVFLLEGCLKVSSAGRETLLKPGDTLINPPGAPHWAVNPGPQVALALWVLAPPVNLAIAPPVMPSADPPD